MITTIFRQIFERFSRRRTPAMQIREYRPVGLSLVGELDMPEVEVLTVEETDIGLPAKVILYNDDFHTYDEVIAQLVKAIRCTPAEAEHIAVEVDTRGLASVYEGPIDQCLSVSSVLEEIELNTSIEF